MTAAPPRLVTYGYESDGWPSDVDPLRIRVRIDGDYKRRVVAYDTIEGWADVLLVDEHGEPQLTDTGDFIAHRYRGKIVAVIV